MKIGERREKKGNKDTLHICIHVNKYPDSVLTSSHLPVSAIFLS